MCKECMAKHISGPDFIQGIDKVCGPSLTARQAVSDDEEVTEENDNDLM